MFTSGNCEFSRRSDLVRVKLNRSPPPEVRASYRNVKSDHTGHRGIFFCKFCGGYFFGKVSFVEELRIHLALLDRFMKLCLLDTCLDWLHDTLEALLFLPGSFPDGCAPPHLLSAGICFDTKPPDLSMCNPTALLFSAWSYRLTKIENLYLCVVRTQW